MTKILFYGIAFLLLPMNMDAQNLVAEIKYVFIDGEEQGIYSGGIHIDAGTLKLGDIIHVTDEANRQYDLKVTEIKDNDTDAEVKVLGASKDGFIVMNTLNGKKLPAITGAFSIGKAKATSASVTNTSTIATTCTINGQNWNGMNYYKSSSYFPKGNSLLKTTKPYLIISFKAANLPDDRQLTIQIKDIKPKVGPVNKNDFEMVISGDANGIKEKACLQSNWKNGEANTIHTDFYLEFTKWEDKGDHIIASGKYSGKLYALNLFGGLIGKSCDDYAIHNGEFNGLKIEVIP